MLTYADTGRQPFLLYVAFKMTVSSASPADRHLEGRFAQWRDYLLSGRALGGVAASGQALAVGRRAHPGDLFELPAELVEVWVLQLVGDLRDCHG